MRSANVCSGVKRDCSNCLLSRKAGLRVPELVIPAQTVAMGAHHLREDNPNEGVRGIVGSDVQGGGVIYHLFLTLFGNYGEARGACGGSDFALFLEGAEGESARTVGWRKIGLLFELSGLKVGSYSTHVTCVT